MIDLDERRLFSNGHEIRLTPKAFDLLRLLIESRPKALSKQEITLRSQRRIPGRWLCTRSLTSADEHVFRSENEIDLESDC